MRLKKTFRNYFLLLGIFSRYHAYTGPIWVQIDITNRCNNNCLYCWARSPLLGEKRAAKNWEESELPFPLIKELISDLYSLNTRRIHFAGGGEPFLHPQFMDIVSAVKEKGFSCDITTNFTLADEGIVRELVKLHVNSITVSMWAGTAHIYKNLHPPQGEECFYRIKDLLRFLVSIKKEEPLPVVRICNVISKINFRDIEQMIDFAKDTAADEYFFQVMDPVKGKTDILLLSDEERVELLKIIEELRPKMEQLSREKNIKVCMLDDFVRRIASENASQGLYDLGNKNSIPCYAGWIFSRITADGNVNFCLKTDEYPVGNLYDHSFRRIWKSRDYANFRKMKIMNLTNSKYSLRCQTTCDNYGQNKMVHDTLKNNYLLQFYIFAQKERAGE